eukprot:1162085-Pelagomonas_calceolata.AAC.2
MRIGHNEHDASEQSWWLDECQNQALKGALGCEGQPPTWKIGPCHGRIQVHKGGNPYFEQGS